MIWSVYEIVKIGGAQEAIPIGRVSAPSLPKATLKAHEKFHFPSLKPKLRVIPWERDQMSLGQSSLGEGYNGGGA